MCLAFVLIFLVLVHFLSKLGLVKAQSCLSLKILFIYNIYVMDDGVYTADELLAVLGTAT